MEKQKGLIVNVFRTNYDATNKGISSKHDSLILIKDESDTYSPNVSKVFEEKFDETLFLKSKIINGSVNSAPYLYAVPKDLTDEQKTMIGPMFGGNFIYTSDSRFPNRYPIPIHDRFEH